MERSTYPFPLAANSSHHSHYHRFLLGADASILTPFPKPYCTGALKGELGKLTSELNLPRWRKLYHAAVPWVAGFGPGHYDLGNVAPHRPLPAEYSRPARRFGAFDLVQIADPSVSALALVAGDRRIVERFVALNDDFCSRVESAASSRHRGPSGSRITGRMLAGHFAEPNNRWLMPFLHVHARVLNFTSFKEEPAMLGCTDPGALARAARQHKSGWIGMQAGALSDLGYKVSLRGKVGPSLCVEGVCGRLVAAIEAPRIAVVRMVERILVGDRSPSAERLGSEFPASVVAAMAEQLERALARSLSFYKPPKIALPSEGPWRSAVREHLSHYCPAALEAVDAAAIRARAAAWGNSIFPTPALDPAHIHAPFPESLVSGVQLPTDPELGSTTDLGPGERTAAGSLLREFEATLAEVNERIVRVGPDDPLVSLRHLLATIDQIGEGAEPSQLRQSELLIDTELNRRVRTDALEVQEHAPSRWPIRAPLVSLEHLFEEASMARQVSEHEIGGRSL
jgi:TrwC relaxase